MRDFTLPIFQSLISVLKQQHYTFQTFQEFIESPVSKAVVIRHDIDSLPFNALDMSNLEKELGVRGTYFFRAIPRIFKKEVILQVSNSGHEIGYHYEDLSLENGDLTSAIKRFENNLRRFRHLYPVKTICMHGSPLSRYDNRVLWEHYDYRDYGIIGEPYFDIDFSRVLYLTDTGRRWDGEGVSVRDKVIVQELHGDRGTGGLRDGETGRRRDGERERLSDGETERLRDGETERLREGETERLRDKGGGGIGGSMRERLEAAGVRLRWTRDIIAAAEKGLLPDQIMITVHPQRWTDNPVLWAKELVLQNVKNGVKWLLVKKRRRD